MKTSKIIFTALLIFSFTFSVEIFSQNDLKNSYVSNNTPSEFEKSNSSASESSEFSNTLLILEQRHKEALENGNYTEAEKISKSMNELIPAENKIVPVEDNLQIKIITKAPELSDNDWLSVNQLVFNAQVKKTDGYFKQIDMKMGEDGYMYMAVNAAPGVNNSGIYFYKSSDFGRTWTYITGISGPAYFGNVSLLVETPLSTNPDSTKMIVFYNSSNTSDMNDAVVRYFSSKANGTSAQYGVIATPSLGNEFSHLSAVSDGAFWGSATYIGVVCTESTNALSANLNLRFFRSTNWGANWVGSTITTGFNDWYPSADFKRGSPDSVYIAVERRSSPTDRQIRVIATPWVPSSNFKTHFVTGASNDLHEKPCLTIKQNFPVDSVLITYTRDNAARYAFSPDGGLTWTAEALLSGANGENKIFTSCSSAKDGNTPFTVCWMSEDGDSINIRRGLLGNMGVPIYKVNSFNASDLVLSVCVLIPSSPSNLTSVCYAGTGAIPTGGYITQEGLKNLSVKIIPQGYYNSNTNKLNYADTIRVYMRSFLSPYKIVDSSKAYIDVNTMTCTYAFNNLSDSYYYIVMRHRNSIDTWSASTVNFYNPGDVQYNFTASAGSAYGNNEISVDNSPVSYAMYGGDINRDEFVDLTDVVMVFNATKIFATGYIPSDVNGDNFADVSDLILTYNNSINFVSVVKP